MELISGTPFAGARAPEKRLTVKSPDIRLQEFPMARAPKDVLRGHIMAAYGVSETLLAKLVDFQKARADARKVKQAFEAARDDDSDYDEL